MVLQTFLLKSGKRLLHVTLIRAFFLYHLSKDHDIVIAIPPENQSVVLSHYAQLALSSLSDKVDLLSVAPFSFGTVLNS